MHRVFFSIFLGSGCCLLLITGALYVSGSRDTSLSSVFWLQPPVLCGLFLFLVQGFAIFWFFQRYRKQMVLQFAASEGWYHSLFANHHAVMLLICPETGKIVDANPAACAFYGYTRDGFLEMRVDQLHVMPRGQVFATMQRAKGERRNHFLFRHRLANGELRDVEVFSGPIYKGKKLFLCSIVYDVTERTRAQTALALSEERYRALFNRMDTGVAVYRVEDEGETFIIADFNTGAERITGRAAQEVIGSRVEEAFPAIADAGIYACFQKVWQTGVSMHHPTVKYADERLAVWVENDIYRLPSGEVVALFTDMTEHKQTKIQEKMNRELLQEVMDLVPQMIFARDADGCYLMANEVTAAFYGLAAEQMIGKRDADFPGVLVEEIRMTLASDQKVLQTDQPLFLADGIHTRSDGEERLVETHRIPFSFAGKKGVIGVGVDVTERRHAEAENRRLQGQLQQARKMESLGRLAGGIAHDFNNILAPILGYAELCSADIRGEDPLLEPISEILQAAHRAKELVGQVLRFTRKDDISLSPVAMDAVLDGSIRFLRAFLPANILLEKTVEPCRPMMGNAAEIQQILMNLSANAAQAMEGAHGHGRICIRLSEVFLSEEMAAGYLDLAPGWHLRLSVADNGCGMRPETVSRIFDPYFTTKPKGEGTGLGLSVVHSIVRRHGGQVRVYSDAGRGTTFHCYFPVVEEGAMPHPSPLTEEKLPHGSERVLFVDDEKTLVAVVSAQLKRLGYTVTPVTDSKEALSCFQSAPDDFDLLITDQTMPGMTGIELVGEVQKLRPDLPVILCSGFMDSEAEKQLGSFGIRRFLAKPVLLEELAQSIRSVLDENSNGAQS